MSDSKLLVRSPVVKLTTLSPESYGEVVRAAVDRGLYFDPSWHANVSATTGYTLSYLVASVSGLKVCVLPIFRRRILCFEMLGSPLAGSHTEYIGPLLLVDGLSDLEISLIAQVFFEYFTRWSIIYFNITFNNFDQTIQYLKLMAEFDRLMPSMKLHSRSGLIDVGGGLESVHQRFEGRLRTDIRKAAKSGVSIEIYRGEDIGKNIESFYEVINSAFLRRNLMPRHPKSFFEGISRLEKASPKFFLAVAEECVVASALTIEDGTRTIYFAGGATPAGLKCSASSLIQFKAIASAIESGALFYDIGGFGDEGIDKFKRSLGSTEYFRTSYLYEHSVVRKLLPTYLKIRRLR